MSTTPLGVWELGLNMHNMYTIHTGFIHVSVPTEILRGGGGADIRRPPSVCGAGEIQNPITTQLHRRQAGVTFDARTTNENVAKNENHTFNP